MADGTPSVDWRPVGVVRRLGAWLLDVALFGATLGVGWLAWTWREWARGSTPGKSIMGMAVFDSRTGRLAQRPRMAKRALGYQGVVVLLGVSTLGLGWLYCLAGMLGPSRRTHCDEWSGVVVLTSPAAGWRRRTGIEPA
ncbi:MAG TPA: RDD family protein [Pseudonocardia sp.]